MNEAIEDQVDKRWLHDGEGIEYLDEQGVEYMYEYAKKCGETIEGVELYYLQDNGEKFYALFSALLKLSEDEYDEEIGKEI